MSNQNGKITAPVTTSDPKTVLGLSSNDVGTLCSSTAINMWAKYKPVPYRSFAPLRSDDSWWHGNDGKCGIAFQTYTSLTAFLAALPTGYAWSHVLPSGGAVEPFRLADYNGYNHYAENPVGDIGATSYTIDSTGSITISYDISAVGDDNLDLADIEANNTPLTDYYLGVYCYNGSRSFYVTGETPIGSTTGLSMTISGLTASYAGTYTLIPFFSSVRLTLNGQASAGVFLSANKAPLQITISAPGSLFYLTAMGNWADAQFSSIEWSVLGTNTGSTAYSFTYSVYLYRKTASQDYPDGELVRSLYSGSVNLPAGASDYPVLDRTDSVTGYSYDYEYYLALVSQAAQTVTTYYPLEDYYPE